MVSAHNTYRRCRSHTRRVHKRHANAPMSPTWALREDGRRTPCTHRLCCLCCLCVGHFPLSRLHVIHTVRTWSTYLRAVCVMLSVTAACRDLSFLLASAVASVVGLLRPKPWCLGTSYRFPLFFFDFLPLHITVAVGHGTTYCVEVNNTSCVFIFP